MKNFLAISILIFFSATFSSCEKDDICTSGTPTTPRMIIEFYDSINTSVLKTVANLKVKGENANSELNFNGVSKIELPLKTNENYTQYIFNINSNTTTNSNNVDVLRFNYTRNDIYVSRACGFKTWFTLNLANPFVKTNPTGDTVYWIENIQVIKNKIESENDVHIKIYF